MDMRVAKEDLKKRLEKYMDHPFAKNHIKSIEIADEYFQLITVILARKKIPYELAIQYGCAILLAHIALTIHDELDRRKMEQTQKQLTILMGAYYSSLYYEILSGVKDSEFIYRLAQGIVKQSETRMKLMHMQMDDMDFFLEKKAEADWIIFSEVLAEFQLDEREFQFYKYKFLELSVIREIEACQSGDIIHSFCPDGLQKVYKGNLNQTLVERVKNFLENL